MAYTIYNANYPNGIALKAPKTFKVDSDDLEGEKSRRTASGTMIRDRIRPRLRTIDIAWDAMNRADMATLINHFNSDAAFTVSNIYGYATYNVPKGFIVIEYPDPYITGDIKRVFFVKSRSTPMFNSLLGYWDGLSLTLEER
jgi:hypothetical protein